MRVPSFIDIECRTADCIKRGQVRRVWLRLVALDVLEMPRLICQICGHDVWTSRDPEPGQETPVDVEPTSTAAIRAWAKQNGLAVSSQGRIPTSVIEQYQAAIA